MATQGRYRPDWTIGTLTLVQGEKDFTTTGSALEVAAIQPGDSIITASGLTLIIESITGQNSGTLMQPCSTLAAGANQPLRIRYQPEGSRLAGMAASLFQMLGSGALYSLGELEGEEGQFLRFLAPGVLEAVAGGNLDALIDLEKIDNLTALAALTLTARQLLQTDATGKLKTVSLDADKALVTDANKDIQQINLADLGRALLALAKGQTTQYVRADGTLQTLNAAAVGLGNVQNLTPAQMPVSTAQQTALNGKANLNGDNTYNGVMWTQQSGNGPTGIQLRATGANSSTGFNISPRIKLKMPRGAMGDADGGFSALFYEENVGVSTQLTFWMNGHGANRYWQMRNDGGIYAEGPINGSAKNFEIDHPADPNFYDLRHCSTEAPEMLVEYRGRVKLQNGRATVNVEDYFSVMPDTFKNLWAEAWVMSLQNQDGFDRLKPRYIDTVTFEIICENLASEDEVTWLLMARRNDPYVHDRACTFTDAEGRLIVEFEKPD